MNRLKNFYKICVVSGLAIFIFLCATAKSTAAEKGQTEAYMGLSGEIKGELQDLKKALLRAGEPSEVQEAEATGKPLDLEAMLLESESSGRDLESKLIRLIVLEQNEDDKKKLIEKLDELVRLKQRLREKELLKEEELFRKIVGRREEATDDKKWETIASPIEKAYSEDLPLIVPRRLEQFGYDIFPKAEGEAQRQQEKKPESDNGVKQLTELLALGQLSQLKESMKGFQGQYPVTMQESSLSRPKRTYSDEFSMTKAVGPDYILGPGDVLTLRMWGAIEGVSDLEIDYEGKILLPKKGPVYIWGKKLADAKKIIENYIRESYSNVQSEVTMGRIKKVQIFVLGDVQSPGAYFLTPQNTVFHALYAASGPTKSGSLRSMRLIRENGEEESIDFYKLLLEGDKSQDMKLSAGDIVFIPSIGDVVGVAGNVKRPAIYEMSHPLKVSELLEMSGGLTPMGYGKRLQIERVERHTKKIVVDLEFGKFSELENSNSNIELANGDLVLVFPVISDKENAVKISGSVKMPGTYELKPDMAVKELIEAAEGLKRDAYLERGEVTRFKYGIAEEVLVFDVRKALEGDETQNPKLKEFDEVTIYREKDVLVRGEVHIDGAVYKPGKYPLTKNMKISDLIFLAGGVKPSASFANAELFKIVLGQPPQIAGVDLEPILKNEKGARDLLLNDGDHLFIREAIEWVEKKTIKLSGEFKYPGLYAARKGETLSSVIARAGGYTEDTFLAGAVLIRKSVKDAEKKAKERFIRMQQRLLTEEEAGLSGSFVYSEEERSARRASIERRRDLIAQLAETETPGRLLINIAPKGGFKGSRYDILIEDGDLLYVPQYPSSVQILGGVYNPSSITYQPGRGIEYYLEKVGGLSKNADKNRIYIIKANGETASRFTRAMVVTRGDTVVIPETFKYVIPPGVLFRDTLAVVTQSLSAAAIVSALTN